MKKLLLLGAVGLLLAVTGFSQTDKFWSVSTERKSNLVADKATLRQAYPKAFTLFRLNFEAFTQQLLSIVDSRSAKHSTIISLPNAAGALENFEVVEASNFEPALQAKFPDIRSFSGRGITDKLATLKLSISPQGIQTMIFRTEKADEFIEPYSKDHAVYAVYASQREKGKLPWNCTTVDEKVTNELNDKVAASVITGRSGGNLKTLRLAQSVTAEYSNYFGATSASQVSLVLAAVNNTLTRCNGVYEKDLAVHLNLVANTTDVFYYNAATDPYANASTGALGKWNSQLQNTLTSVIGEANYDIGHLFGASGGGGNAGCIGCICVNGSKGSGFTSPADGIPQGDNFDIDYVVHEVGHQLGANHTFSYSNEGTGVNVEIGSGITIMGYAGITSYDVAPHSIDIYHAVSIAQIQANLATKTCPVTTAVTNSTPVVAAVSNYTIPKSTPFALTGSATDADAGDVLTYCWEENDNGGSQTGAKSVASPAKASGPNWVSFLPTISPTRYFPQLSTILTGDTVTGPLPGGDKSVKIEALSSIARALNFRLTVRDNAVYSSTAPVNVAQTNFTDMVVTVSAASGPFRVTAPNTAVSYTGGSSQTITWDVAGTTVSPVSCANVKISLSTDGGQTFPTVLAASTPNDGSEVLTIPNTATTTARIKIESVGNIFFDISNSNFAITGSAPNCTTAFEPNDKPANAAAITLGATNTAAISTSADIDFYKITTTATSNIVYSLAGPSGVNYDLYIYNTSSKLLGSGTTSSATETVSLNQQAAGTYYIRVVGKNGAFSSACYTLTATSSVALTVQTTELRTATETAKSISVTTGVSVYPNPVRSTLKINMGKYADAVSVTVIDMYGSKAASANFSGASNINMSQLASGVYMVIIRDKAGVIMKQERIVKE